LETQSSDKHFYEKINWNPTTGIEDDFLKILYLVAMATRGITIGSNF